MKFILIVLIIFNYLSVYSQYTGGDADGFTFLLLSQSNGLYDGGGDDGFGVLYFTQEDFIYNGESKDGFACISLEQEDYLYVGGISDGFTSMVLEGDNTIYQGANRDGFASINMFQKYIWTGTIGTGWNVVGNWSTNQVPTLRHSVIIPNGVPYYPAVNSGLLSIGKDPTDSSTYRCNNILIMSGANMTTRVNCFVDVYGTFKIDGTLYVKNPSNNAFVVKKYGELRLVGGHVIVSSL